MNARVLSLALLSGIALALPTANRASADGGDPSPQTILDKSLEADPWGLGGVELASRVIVVDKNGKKRELAFEAKSKRYDPPRSKGIISFNAPADVAGMRFLQVQNKDGDDERALYVPELKRTRRIAAAARSDAFMGTDYSYADMDMRDMREGSPTLKGTEPCGKHDCYRLEVKTKGDALYGKFDMLVRKDNFVRMKTVMFDKSNKAVKTQVTKELQKHKDRWHITRCVMTDHAKESTTELAVEKLDPKDFPLSDFTQQKLEKGG